jgi:hypothetical protein
MVLTGHGNIETVIHLYREVLHSVLKSGVEALDGAAGEGSNQEVS